MLMALVAIIAMVAFACAAILAVGWAVATAVSFF
jgi:hypothetical protein